jgi:hypothetical protein
MVRRLRAHFRQQFVGYLALFVALGGTAYAAATIGPAQIKNDAVRSRHVDDGEVKNADLGANSVATGKVRNGTLLRKDFKAGQLPAAIGPAEPVRLVREPSGNNNCPAATGEFCRVDTNFGGSPTTFRMANYGDGYAPAGFYKDRSGVVHLQGSIESLNPAPVPAFVLPPGYRPTGGTRWFGAWNSGPESKHGAVRIGSDGVVQPEQPSSFDYLSLDGIQFRP